MKKSTCLALTMLVASAAFAEAQQPFDLAVSTDLASNTEFADTPTVNSNYDSQALPPTSAQLSFPSLASDEPSQQAPAPKSEKSFFAAPILTVGFSLSIVLGLFAGLIWLARRYGGATQSTGSIPSEVMETLGSTMLDARTRVSLLRCGTKVLVVAQTATGIHSLGEIDDPTEVNAMVSACNGKSSFSEALAAKQPRGSQQAKPTSAAKRSHRLFATA